MLVLVFLSPICKIFDFKDVNFYVFGKYFSELIAYFFILFAVFFNLFNFKILFTHIYLLAFI